MTRQVTFTKKLARSGKGYLSWVPKNIVDYCCLDETTYAELSIKSLDLSQDPLIFTKRIAKSGRGYLIWIPKDVSDYLKLDENSTCEFKLKVLGGEDEN